jgi:hypothetical protein
LPNYLALDYQFMMFHIGENEENEENEESEENENANVKNE